MIDTTWWEQQDAAQFLAFNWSHPSRAWATDQAIAMALAYGGDLLEVGPGSGVDYARAFRPFVERGELAYTGYEPTRTFHVALQAAYPEARWVNDSTDALPPREAAVVYARAVLEHQPRLRPALDRILDAARYAVVLDWYRPPSPVASCDVVGGVPCHTFARDEVVSTIEARGFVRADQRAVGGNEVWRLVRA